MTISTHDRGPATDGRMARKRKWSEDMVARFRAGTFARISVLLDETEDRTDFIREAVEREIERRERAKEQPAKGK